LDQLSRMENWLLHEGRAELSACDRPILTPGLARLVRDTASVSQLTDELLAGFQHERTDSQ
jgi:hypothetical protein